ncbi:hypothetical protein [Actinophytocola sp.]|uniref:hypothetical protein n=1 Tax=Actinophytocola sp. TaxID=1872138 RepID=UPI00389AA683
MAVLHPDLSIHTTAHSAPPPDTGMTGRGYITASVAQLRDRFGRSHHQLAPDGDTEVWGLHTPAGLVYLRAGTAFSDPTDERDVQHRCLIHATSDDVLPWVYKAVHGSTTAFPTGAFSHFTEATLHDFGYAYLGYLYLRMNAEIQRRDQLDRTASDFRTHLHRPRQLNGMLIKLADVLHHYEWAHASETERTAWSRMQRPTPREGLRYWKARNRWLYKPVTSERHPRGGDPDLPGMLRALADSARSHRGQLLEKVPELDLVLHNEHEQTLRALADIPIPGLDALQFSCG